VFHFLSKARSISVAQAGKLSQKELKQPDTFQSRGEQIVDHLVANRKRYLIYGGAAVLVILIALGVASIYEKRNATISKRFGEAFDTYNATVEREHVGVEKKKHAPGELTFPTEETKYLAALEKFRVLAEQNSGTTYGRFALFYQANSHFMLGQYSKALEVYEKFLSVIGSDFNDLRFVAENNIAQCHDALGELDKAAETYQKMVDDPVGLFRDQALFMLAKLAARQGKRDEAITKFNSVLEKFPDSEFRPDVEKQLTLLGAPKPSDMNDPEVMRALQQAQQAAGAKAKVGPVKTENKDAPPAPATAP